MSSLLFLRIAYLCEKVNSKTKNKRKAPGRRAETAENPAKKRKKEGETEKVRKQEEKAKGGRQEKTALSGRDTHSVGTEGQRKDGGTTEEQKDSGEKRKNGGERRKETQGTVSAGKGKTGTEGRPVVKKNSEKSANREKAHRSPKGTETAKRRAKKGRFRRNRPFSSFSGGKPRTEGGVMRAPSFSGIWRRHNLSVPCRPQRKKLSERLP